MQGDVHKEGGPSDGRQVRAAQRQQRARRRRLRGRILWAVVALALASVLVLVALPSPVPVDVAEANKGVLRVTVDEDGQTRVVDRYVVSAPITGNLRRISLRAGDEVKAGDVLARLLPTAPALLDPRSHAEQQARLRAAQAAQRQAQAAVDEAQANFAQARRERRRQEQLAKGGAVPYSALEQAQLAERTARASLASARFAVQVAAHEVQVAKAALTRGRGTGQQELVVDAPVDGTVLRVVQASAGVVQAGAPLLELGDLAAMEITADVLTSEAVGMRPGSPATVTEWGGGESLRAHVKRVEPGGFTKVSALGVEEQRTNVLLALDAPRSRWEQLGDGYRVEVSILVREVKEALIVPTGALFRYEQGWAAFTIQKGRAKVTPLKIGARSATLAQVEEGLAPGTKVIVYPSDRVREGVRVKIREPG